MEVTDRSLLNRTITTGEAVVVQADLANFYPARGRITLNLTADGALAARRTVTVGIDARRTVYLDTRFETPGRYRISLDGSSVGTVNVVRETRTATGSPSATPTRSSEPTRTSALTPTSVGTDTPMPVASVETVSIETTGGSGPGFGVGAPLVALVILAGWSIARRGRRAETPSERLGRHDRSRLTNTRQPLGVCWLTARGRPTDSVGEVAREMLLNARFSVLSARFSVGIDTVSNLLDGEDMPSLESMLDDVLSGPSVVVRADDLRVATLRAGNASWVIHPVSPVQYLLSAPEGLWLGPLRNLRTRRKVR